MAFSGRQNMAHR